MRGEVMTAKQYLSQAYRLDQRIESKIGQIDSLNALSTRMTATLTGMPRNPSPAASQMEEAIARVIDLETEVDHDVKKLVDLKREIVQVIKAVENTECQMLLEKRYLCFQKWEQIAVDMGFSIENVYCLHRKALAMIRIP